MIEIARGSVYSLQKVAIEQLGELYVSAAGSLLEQLVRQEIDVDMTVRAREAREDIERITSRPIAKETVAY